ncbi:MAG: ABC transporter ATP-binding protein [Chitinophagales bacterium]
MQNKTSVYRHIIKQALPYKNWFIGCFILAVIISALTPIRPYILQQIIDVDIKTGQKERLVFNASLLFGLLIFESLLKYIFVYATSFFSQNIVNNLRKKVFSHLMNLHVQYYDETPIGRLTTRTVNDVETINEVYSDNFFTIVSDILTIIFVLGFMLYTNVQLTLISLVTLPFLYLATYIFKEKVKVVNEKLRDKIGELNAFVQEHLMGFKIVKAFAVEDKEQTKFNKINAEFTELNFKSIWYYSWFFPVLETLISISIGLVVSYVAIYSFEQKDLSAGVITSFLLYLNLLFRPMRFIADKFNSIQMGFVASNRVFDLLDTPTQEADQGTINNIAIRGDIRFDKVSFSYSPEVPVLRDVSFQIEAGKSLAIVGATGSGKTSIINILNRFYPYQSGKIYIDQHPIEDFILNFLRSQIAMVLQDVYLFSGSILDNIVVESTNTSREEIIQMATQLDIHDFFMKLPNNYDFEIKERGSSLSHGQKQIISLFRAIAKKPSILILDDSTSSIDSNPEFYIQKLISQSIKNTTSIVIAHRLSTIMQADKILVLDHGVIVGEGTHTSLLQTNTYYKKYFQSIENKKELI